MQGPFCVCPQRFTNINLILLTTLCIIPASQRRRLRPRGLSPLFRVMRLRVASWDPHPDLRPPPAPAASPPPPERVRPPAGTCRTLGPCGAPRGTAGGSARRVRGPQSPAQPQRRLPAVGAPRGRAAHGCPWRSRACAGRGVSHLVFRFRSQRSCCRTLRHVTTARGSERARRVRRQEARAGRVANPDFPPLLFLFPRRRAVQVRQEPGRGRRQAAAEQGGRAAAEEGGPARRAGPAPEGEAGPAGRHRGERGYAGSPRPPTAAATPGALAAPACVIASGARGLGALPGSAGRAGSEHAGAGAGAGAVLPPVLTAAHRPCRPRAPGSQATAHAQQLGLSAGRQCTGQVTLGSPLEASGRAEGARPLRRDCREQGSAWALDRGKRPGWWQRCPERSGAVAVVGETRAGPEVSASGGSRACGVWLQGGTSA